MFWIIIHLPHILPAIIGFSAVVRLGFWAADQPPQQYSDEEVAQWRALREAARAERRRPVIAAVARLGVTALLPLGVAFGSGLWIYTVNLRNDRPSQFMIWLHVGASIAGLAVVQLKVSRIGWRRLRAGISLRRPHDALASLVLLALGVPLVITGVMLLVAPNGRSLTDYIHLIASVWWVILVQWHLWRYLGRALGAALRQPRAHPGPSTTI